MSSLSDQLFTGKVALITGAARGIGAAVARGYAAHGGRVALVGLEPELLSQLSDELGDSAAWWSADVRDDLEVKAAIDAAAAHFGRLDHVVANAGIASYGTVRQITDATFTRVMDINVGGVFRTLHHAIPHLEKTNGYALAISSLAAFTTIAGLAPYASSKAAVEALAIATGQEVLGLGITVGVCHPGWIDTDLVRSAEDDLPSFKAVRKKLPYPANTTTDVATCADEILKGVAARKGRIYVPKSVGLANWGKALVNSPIGRKYAANIAGRTIPQMEREVEAMGRQSATHVPISKKD
jgi:NAD(P)-dependent dehydrogenase (short-subunit alcohol dehydrogenase family)